MNCTSCHKFLSSESGAVTVDWVVLTAAVAGMALAATSVIEDGISTLASDLEAELRTQQVSDAFVVFTSSAFNTLYDQGVLTEATAQTLFDSANAMTNADIMSAVESGVLAYNDNLLSDAEVAVLVAQASVGLQRNILSASDVAGLPIS